MSQQSHAPSIWREPAGAGAVPTVGALRIVLLSPGVYALAEVGAPAGALSDLGSGKTAVTDTATSGTSAAMRIGTATGVIY